ncbi:Nucleoside triphosphate pyrophosphohydrolase/pyrophosphatase MazG,nucleoside triphosphate pyrophosphohydrolase,MazG family protein,MazG nucleotide pyrophosphohydrolase domain [Chlamydia poikilotherma]|uniref:Nucleoside triphosphate pyrophosphohydrolase/pyrophosphatase MazG,nucleoside triphosphate pyrophosphohydrolase,MazG family protein,MazG nucleotide pyrophosphohydrolase domain n=1 Tax=Chlamydia poikilotherma TaxID=1967783 RepID=A0A3B0PVJ1_9CHLA|nr:MazG nucleotide pyrophosphohydrolase domain-containing protein [Chlamydia poikilotherma]SYX08876.1 Nucleoside triphosphate pyrophosphohydrolase/pyrophosphatase MazG,nucleoside triphosphate pyrophosphohydrolase,MazG family protein,MazG nucleotide pyrophosphohydrolase domain [Chlamydia poikilotherma]
MKNIDFSQLIELVRKMVADGICPWTDHQDFDSILSHILQECKELSEAVHEGYSIKEVTSEAGDVLTLVLLLCFKMEFLGMSSLDAIISEALAKIRRRAPHVFDPSKRISYEEARTAWALAKLEEKSEK